MLDTQNKSRGVYVLTTTERIFLLEYSLPSAWLDVYSQSIFASSCPLPALPLCVPSSQVATASSDSSTLQPSRSSFWVALNCFLCQSCWLDSGSAQPKVIPLPDEVRIRPSWTFWFLGGPIGLNFIFISQGILLILETPRHLSNDLAHLKNEEIMHCTMQFIFWKVTANHMWDHSRVCNWKKEKNGT